MPHARPNDLFAAFLRNAMSLRVLVGALLAILSIAPPAFSDTPVALYESLAGSINITGTGGTLRTNPDGVNPCTVTNNGSMTLSGIPAGATVRTAYLYWAGSGGDPQGGVGTDYTVTFNGTAVTADRTYTASYNAGGGNVVYFFGGVTDVTSQVTANGVYTFADLTVQNANVGGGGQYCTSSAVLSAFSLLVIYDDPAEILHVVNVWEGFQGYRGASITLTPTNFIVPTPAPVAALSSRILILTWEGDSGNSGALGGFNESLTFCSPAPCAGTALTDAYNPLNNQFNSTVDVPPSGPFSGIDTIWGNDLDMYDITSSIPAGAASAQSVYSSGGDLVILMNQTMAIPNVPVADLAINKSHSGNFAVSSSGTYTIGVTNNGPNSATGTITVTDTLPAGLTYSSATGTGWTCGAVGQDVTCTRPGPLASGASAPNITLTVSVGAAAYPSVTNTASVSSATFDNVAGNDSSNDLTLVEMPDLSTSTKTWVDPSGGDQDPGDTIRYTITLTNTASIPATGVTVTDTLPAPLTGPAMVSCPSGATCGFAGQTLTATNVTVPAISSVTIEFDATIAAVPPGTLIDNIAFIANPSGPGATPAASTIVVSDSSIPMSGNKPLYLYDAASTPAYMLSRTPPTAGTWVTINVGASQTWTQDPAAQLPITIDPSINNNVPVYLYMRRNGGGATNGIRNITVNLQCSSGGTVLTQTQNVNLNANAITLQTFNLPVASPVTCGTGNTWNLTVSVNAGSANPARVYPYTGGNVSRAVLPVTTVINVDSISFYDAPYPGGSPLATTLTGTTVYVRSVVSDPFGSFDITAASIIITDATGSVPVSGAPMTELVTATTPSTKTYEYQYAIPAAGPAGNWTFRVDAAEGTEGTITDYGLASLSVILPAPNILTLKSVSVISDPINTGPPYRSIPGAVMEYTVIVTNSGPGPVDTDSTVLTDAVPANMTMYVDSGPGDPVTFSCSAVPPCGLTFTYGANVSYTDTFPLPALLAPPNACGNFTYVPSGSFDANVRGICINPAGVLNGSSGPPDPQFTIKYRMQVN